MSDILLDGITFHFDDYREIFDEDGISWIATEITGFRGAPASRVKHTDRPGTFGSFRNDNFKSTREVTIGGTIGAGNTSSLRIAEEKLAGICADPTKLYEVRYQDDAVIRYLYVEPNGSFDIKPRTWNTSVWESIPLIAPDPRKFGSWTSVESPTPVAGTSGVNSGSTGVSSAGSGVNSGTDSTYPSVNVSNPGSAPGSLVVEFIGPATNPMFMNAGTGVSVQLRAVLLDGESRFVNVTPHFAYSVPGMPLDSYIEGRSIWSAGTYMSGSILSVANGNYPDFPAGENTNYIFVNGQGNVHARPAYW
jgi:hypothetical protein